MNPLSHLYEQFNVGDPAEKHANLPAGPLMIDLEPVGVCNLRCVMCPTGLQALGRPGSFMDIETHRSILNKTAPYKSAMRYIGWGEPTLHPHLIKFLKEANSAGRLTHLNTNALKMTSRFAEQLVDSGLDSIKFSFQGTDRTTYQAMRGADFFEGMIEAINMVWLARGAGTRPFIAASTSTTDETPEQIEAFRQRVEPLVDELGIGHTIFEFIDMKAVPAKQRGRLEAAAKRQTVVKKHPDPCPEVYGKLTIHWDGAVRVCCNDFSGKTLLGNIATDSLPKIWRHPAMEAYRERLDKKDYNAPLCETCFEYMPLHKKEEAAA